MPFCFVFISSFATNDVCFILCRVHWILKRFHCAFTYLLLMDHVCTGKILTARKLKYETKFRYKYHNVNVICLSICVSSSSLIFFPRRHRSVSTGNILGHWNLYTGSYKKIWSFQGHRRNNWVLQGHIGNSLKNYSINDTPSILMVEKGTPSVFACSLYLQWLWEHHLAIVVVYGLLELSQQLTLDWCFVDIMMHAMLIMASSFLSFY
jgi:hypothetical protein